MYIVADAVKPDLDNDLLMHYGMKGMKWGVRRGSSKTGISRTRGGTIDRNARNIYKTNKKLSGKGLQIGYRLDKIAMGKSRTDRLLKVNIAEMKDQNARLKSGKATVRDKIHMLMTTTPIDLVLSNRPK